MSRRSFINDQQSKRKSGVLVDKKKSSKKALLLQLRMGWFLLIIAAMCLTYLLAESQMSHNTPENISESPYASLTASPEKMIWTCDRSQPQRCKRVLLSEDPEGYSTQDLCQLTCGACGPLWPKPTGRTWIGQDRSPLDIWAVTFMPTESLLLGDMFTLFLKEVALLACGKTSCVPCPENQDCKRLVVNIKLKKPNVVALEWHTNESYSLKVSKGVDNVLVNISAETVFGARHALQSLYQLIEYDGQGKHLIIASNVQIEDGPKFTHRGVMLDTSRHFLPISVLERTLEAMATVKLNVLHLHLTDSHSFPVRSRRVPQLAEWGAYSPQETYSMEELEQLAHFALVRGIRIIPELDTPAHAGNGWQWGPQAGLGDLALCVNSQPWENYCLQPPCGQLNPANPQVFNILGVLYRELKEALHPHANSVFHVGGDEIEIKCWNSSTEVTNWIKEQTGHKTLKDEDFDWAWKYFQEKTRQQLDAAYQSEPSVMIWSSAYTHPDIIEDILDKNRYVIQTWSSSNEGLPESLIQLGYKVVISHLDAWYLDWGFWGDTRYAKWAKVYDIGLPRRALGGEVTLWTELVDKMTVDSRLWPRSAAFAERVWSNPRERAYYSEGRLLHWRRRIVKTKGIQASSITPQYCEMAEGHCGTR